MKRILHALATLIIWFALALEVCGEFAAFVGIRLREKLEAPKKK